MWIWRHVVKVLWTKHITNVKMLQMVATEREIMDTVRSRQMARSHPETRLITENNVTTNTVEEGLQETKNNAFRLATKDGGRQY